MFKIPDEAASLIVFGQGREEAFPKPHFKLLVWNVWKGRRGDIWAKDFLRLAEDTDLILLQEAVTTPMMSQLFQRPENRHEWLMAVSFAWKYATHTTGVMTGSAVHAKTRKFLRGSERELFFWTPKVTLATQYSVKNREDLLVINTHVVNFTSTTAFVRFVRELSGLITHHKGPVILAGDFNTWNTDRWTWLEKILISEGLWPVNFHGDPRFMKLDHVFVRGLKPINAHVQADIRSSDHYPLLAEFEILKNDEKA